MSFERSYSVDSHERIKQLLIFGDKSLLLMWWDTYSTCKKAKSQNLWIEHSVNVR